MNARRGSNRESKREFNRRRRRLMVGYASPTPGGSTSARPMIETELAVGDRVCIYPQELVGVIRRISAGVVSVLLENGYVELAGVSRTSFWPTEAELLTRAAAIRASWSEEEKIRRSLWAHCDEAVTPSYESRVSDNGVRWQFEPAAVG